MEPRGTSAWDLYQRLAAEQSVPAELTRLKPMLADAFVRAGKAILVGDVRTDNIADKVEDFRKAGQMLTLERTLAPASDEVAGLEKLSAAQALVALQFYDEAEKALAQLRAARLAAVENALGIVYAGKLDDFQAERAFKRAIEIDPNWAAPHYNLALLYRSQKNDAALSELETAGRLAPENAVVQTAIGDEYFARQEWQRAVEAYRKAVTTSPADSALRTKLGHALYSQGLRDEANREYQRASELNSKKPF
jgi:tetratricopeptide (TPR) repeat protein